MRSGGRALAAAVTWGVALLAFVPESGAAAPTGTPPAGDYPARPIRIVVPFPPGAGTDIIARLLAQVLGEAWRQTVIVDNRTGAGGTIGSDIVAKASPDGYTLLLGNVSTLALAPSLYPKLPYVPLRDFAPIILITTSHNVLVTHPAVAANSVKELIALAKAKPGHLTYGSSGSGTTSHLGGALFAHMAGVQLVHVPYKGSAPAHVDLLAGQLHLSFSTIVTTLPFIKGGRLKGLAVTSLNRSPLLPGLPTVAETLPGFEVLVWQGMVAPGATPRAIIVRLNQEIAKSLHGPQMREQLAKQGLEAVGNSPEEFTAFIKSETGKWGKVIRLTGAKAE